MGTKDGIMMQSGHRRWRVRQRLRVLLLLLLAREDMVLVVLLLLLMMMMMMGVGGCR
jgi:hypothetical protein